MRCMYGFAFITVAFLGFMIIISSVDGSRRKIKRIARDGPSGPDEFPSAEGKRTRDTHTTKPKPLLHEALDHQPHALVL